MRRRIAAGVAQARAASIRARHRPPDAARRPQYEKVFFVVGEMRSGTSWLRRVLAAHPEVACGREGSFFGRDYDREEIPVYTEPVSSLARSLAVSEELKTWHALPWNLWSDDYEQDLANLTRVSTDYFLSKEVARTGKRVVGDKSPQHTACLDELHEVYPDAHIVHIVRDGRDVAVSAMHHWWRLAKDQEGGLFELEPEELERRDAYRDDREAFGAAGRSIFTEERLVQLARRWSHRVGKARHDGAALYRRRYFELRYEELLGDGPTTITRTLRSLDVRTDQQALRRCLRAGSFARAANRSRGTEDSESFFRKGVAGDWRAVFTDHDREIYAEHAGERLIELGYERSRDW